MAQLKDLIVNGASRLIGDVYTSNILISTINAQTSASSAVYGPGSNGQILKSNGSIVYWASDNNAGGTVTSVQVLATSPVVSSLNTAQSGTLSTTISLSDAYGDTKNPYGNKTANYVLAAPNGSAGAPTFRALVANDIPLLTKSKISDFPTSMTPTSHIHGNISNDGKIGTTADYAVYTTTGGAVTTGNFTVSSPSADGNTTSFIDTVSLDSKGKISATKKTITSATTSTAGIMAMSATNLNIMINLLSTGNTTPTDNDYYISLYVNGGSTTSTYHRRPISALYTYVVNKLSITDKGATLSFGNTATIATIGGTDIKVTMPATPSDTKNTAGSTNDTAKLFLVGAKSLAANAQTYSHTGSYALSGKLYSDGKETVTSVANKTGATITLDSLDLFGKTYNGSTAVTITPADIGLSGSMNFKGIITNNLSDGDTTSPVSLKAGGTVTPSEGDVVIDSSGEQYVWSNNGWRALGYATDYALLTHVHGNIEYKGVISTTATIANNDRLIIADASDSDNGKLVASSITFDGSTTTKALTQKGTWETFNNYSHPTTSGNKHIPSGGSSGQFLGWDSDGTAAWVANPNVNPTVTTTGTGNAVTSITGSGSEITVVKGATYNNYSHPTTSGNKHIPSGGSSGQFLGWDSDGTAAWVANPNSMPTVATTGTGNAITSVSISGTEITAIKDGEYLPLSGGEMTGMLKTNGFSGTLNIDYGEILPATGTEGQIFYLLSDGNNAANLLSTTAATADTNYYIIGAIAAGQQLPYIATANSSGTANTGGIYFNGASGVLFGAAWNDYAEYRIFDNFQSDNIPYGYVVIENGLDGVKLSSERLLPCGLIVSDCYGFILGNAKNAVPVALCGRVLAYPLEDRNSYQIGDAVCTGPDGKISKMSREEIKEWPDRIIGYVSSIPQYDIWNEKHIKVNNRIWIKVK